LATIKKVSESEKYKSLIKGLLSILKQLSQKVYTEKYQTFIISQEK